MGGARWWIAALLLAGCKGHTAVPADSSAPPASPTPSGAASAATALGAAAALPAPAASGGAWLGTQVPVPEVPPESSTAYPMFRKTTLSIDELTNLVTSAPELARVGREIAFFDPGDVQYLTRSSADHADTSFTSQPLLWSPMHGRQVLLVAAHGKAASFVGAWWVLPGGGYRLASSFVMLGEIAPIALAWRPLERGTVWWTSCWHCPGETGRVTAREDGHLVIVQD